MSILLDIGDKGLLKFEDVLDLLKCVEKENLFTNFPIGTTIQDGGKRKRSDEPKYDDKLDSCWLKNIYLFCLFHKTK